MVTLMDEEDVEELERKLMGRLQALPPGGTLRVSFVGVRIASGAARKLLVPALRYVQSAEGRGRTLVLDELSGSTPYNVRAMLRSEELAAVVRDAGGRPALDGAVDAALESTFAFVAGRPEATAHDVQGHFGLQTVAAATNRLARLHRLGALRRDGPRPLPAGGIEYVYTAVTA